MRWELIYGKDLHWIESLPEGTPAKDKPELWPENVLAVRVFSQLIGQRESGMSGSGEIPVDRIVTWAYVYDIEDVPDLMFKVTTLDKEFLKWIREKQQEKVKKSNV